MPRTRDLRPGFFKNENLGECQPLARLLFAGLWIYADREGKLEDRPKRLRSEILPYDNCDGDELLSELAEYGFVIRYEIEGKRYLKITGFEDNQRIHPKEQPSTIPDPEYIQNHGLPLQGDDKQMSNRTIPSSPSSPSRNNNCPSAKVEVRPDENEFLKWWETYPRKEAKKNARKAYWVARKTVSAETLLEGVLRYRASKPHYADWKVPTTWLNGEHWEDEEYKPGYTDAPTAGGNAPKGPTRLERLMASKYIQNTWDKQVLKVEDLRLDRHDQLWNGNEKLELTEYEPYEEEKAPC